MSRSYSARVMRFRSGVYASRGRISAGCQVLLLRLSDDMDAKAVVSVPRSRLAADLGCPLPRITEWIKQAVEAGFLGRVRRGRPGVTAVYRGQYVAPEVRQGVPSQRYAGSDHPEVRQGVPHIDDLRYAQHGSQVVGSALRPSETSAVLTVFDAGSDNRARRLVGPYVNLRMVS